jgi:hypothetical protein
MSGIVLTFPILAGKVEPWRRFCQELSGSQLQMYIVSRRRLGITSERMVLVENAYGAMSVITLEAPDVNRVVGQMMISNLPFDRWYREQMQELHGVNLRLYKQASQPTPPLPQDQELLFEWELFSEANAAL